MNIHTQIHRARRPGRLTQRRPRATFLTPVEPLEERLFLNASPPAQILRDVNVLPPPAEPSEIVQVGNKIFFAASDGYHGRELFVSDGVQPARLVADIVPGFFGSDPQWLTDVGGTLFFTADDGVHGRELWMSDGTAAGTRMVADIFPGESDIFGIRSSDPTHLTAAHTLEGSRVFFVAETEATGRELWVADTATATLVIDLYPGSDEFNWPHGSEPRDLTFVPMHQLEDLSIVPPRLFFSAEAPATGRELYKTDLVDGGTQTTLLANIFEDLFGQPPNSSNPHNLIRYNNEVYFSASDGSFDDVVDGAGNIVERDRLTAHGFELWKTDGTFLGTEMVLDINPGTNTDAQGREVPLSSSPGEFAVHNGQLYFAATDNTFTVGPQGVVDTATGRELWRTDGTAQNTGLVADIRAGVNNSSPRDLTSTDGRLFFAASDSRGFEIWSSDGTAAGTMITRDIRPGAGSPLLFSTSFAKVGSSLIFSADDGNLGPEVWISDGTADGTHVLKETQFGRNSSVVPVSFTNIAEIGYFQTAGQFWRTDGTFEGTRAVGVETMATVSSEPSSLAAAAGLLFFAANDGINGMELWKSDGTTPGTVLVRDIAAGTEIIFPGSSIATPRSSNPSQITAVGDRVFFTTSLASELWVSDGTAAGTVAVKDIEPAGDAGPGQLVHFNGLLAFTATTLDHGTEVWISDGTPDGTRILRDIGEGEIASFPDDLTVAGNRLFFVAEDINGRELWVSDGTEEGTHVLDLAPNDVFPDGSLPSRLTAVGDTLYFTADDGLSGFELFKSDGTMAGTQLVRDIFDTGGLVDFSGSYPAPLGVVDTTLYFFADDGVVGRTLWKTDGTTAGTVLVHEIFAAGDNPFCTHQDFEGPFAAAIANQLYFTADDGIHGCELWMTDGTRDNTRLVADLFPGFEASHPMSLTAVGDTVYFTARNHLEFADGEVLDLGRELWVSDGTAAGTTVHTVINLITEFGSDPVQLTRVGGAVFFSADDGLHGREIWTTHRRLKADDLVLEILARDFAYRNLNQRDPISLETDYNLPFEFEVDAVFQDPLTGFSAFGLVGDNVDPVLAVRGTQEGIDWIANAHPDGVGITQFEPNKEAVRNWLTAQAAAHPVSITGHSLGGALTQLIAADFTSFGRRLDQVVTFAAPGISSEYADQFDPDFAGRVKHYITNGDLVSMAGEAFLPGQWRRSTFSDLDLSNNHTLPVLTNRLIVDKPPEVPDEVRFRPDDLVFEEFPDVSWLSNDFYFHTDLDYFLVLAALQVGVDSIDILRPLSHIPPALLFRSTTEALRQEIGTHITNLVDAVNNILDVLTCASSDARVTLPDFEHTFFNLLTVVATDLSASCFDNDDPPLRLQGTVRLPQLYNVTGDFAGDNFIGLSSDGFDLRGTISVEDIHIVPNVWVLKELTFGVDTTATPIRLGAGGMLQIPTGIVIEARVEFAGTALNSVTLGLDDINRPIGATGIFLQRIAGSVHHIAEVDPEPTLFEGEVGASGGPEVTIQLPSWAGGEITGTLLDFTVTGTIDRDHLVAGGTLNIINGLATAQGQVELNWRDGFLAGGGQLNVLSGLITADASFRADSSLDINMFADATFRVPDVIPFIGGSDAVSGKFALAFTHDANFANDAVAAWTTINIPIIGDRSVGFRVYLNGDFDILGGNEIAQLDAGGAVAALTATRGTIPPTAILAHVAGHAVRESQFAIDPATPWVLFAAEWDNDSPGTQIILTTPGGVELNEADISARPDMELVAALSSSTRRVVVVTTPDAGTWTVSVNDDQALDELTFHALAGSGAPTIRIDRISGGPMRTPVAIQYDARDADSNAAVSFFYDTDNQGFDGIRFAGATETDGPGTITWNPGAIPAGNYFIYAAIDDGVHAPLFVYAANAVQITEPGSGAGIMGIKFEDLDGDGTRDAGEPGLNDWTIQLLDAAGQLLDTAVTGDVDLDSDGQIDPASERGVFRFLGLPAGRYAVSEPATAHWTATVPLPTAPIDLELGTIAAAPDIGNFHNVSLRGTVFHDADGDGSRDANEPGLEGWTVFVDSNHDGILNNPGDGDGLCGPAAEPCARSDATGSYVITDLGPGTHRVRQVMQPDWLQTTPDPAELVAQSDTDLPGTHFGNRPAGAGLPDPSDGRGQVAVVARRRKLIIQGDHEANHIRIVSRTSGDKISIVVAGLGQTQINGQSNPVEFDQVPGKITIDLEEGNDWVHIDGTLETIHVPGTLHLSTGAGNDTVRIQNAVLGGRLQLDTAEGDDSVTILDSVLNEMAVLRTRGGRGWWKARPRGLVGSDGDMVVLDRSRFRGHVLIDTGADADRVAIDDSEFEKLFLADLGSGPDQLRIERGGRGAGITTYHDAVLISTGTEDDTVEIGESGNPDRAARFSSAFLTDGGSGSDRLDAGLDENPNANGNQFRIAPLVRRFEL